MWFIEDLDLRDVLERAPEAVSHLVDEVPLLLGDRGAHVVRRHLGLVKQPLEDEEGRCNIGVVRGINSRNLRVESGWSINRDEILSMIVLQGLINTSPKSLKF